MATNYIQPGDVITIPAAEAVLSGGVVIAGEIIGIAQGHAIEGEPVDVKCSGVWQLPKVAANAFAVGDAVFFDLDTALATTTEGDNPKLGVAVAAAIASTATVTVRLSGF
ncbi:DUF2190 family protein [uncultured Paracoccus sp.]|uniref:DUF2190 family protein n=1 Tax=uncultured Paracoccus sp. TaxID=189685 RepID=UPI0025FA2940|nr:DUF2190 family protein [uncultured Paracoccus sp.]